MTGEVDELKSKVSPVTVGFAIILVVIGYYVGYVHSELKSQGERMQLQYNYSINEVDGLRQDVYREDKHLQKQIDEMRKPH